MNPCQRSHILLWSALLAVTSTAAWTDSLFDQQAQEAGTLIAEKKERFKPGDIITVMVQEKVTAKTQANTRTRKESDVESKAPVGSNQFPVGNSPDEGANIFQPGELPNWKIEAENEHRGQGETIRKSEFTTNITCVVTRVLPNDTLMLEGEKRITINREDSILVVSGIVRAKDVTPANTVLSTQMAASTVELKGKGPLWNNQRRGLVTRILDWFSPF